MWWKNEQSPKQLKIDWAALDYGNNSPMPPVLAEHGRLTTRQAELFALLAQREQEQREQREEAAVAQGSINAFTTPGDVALVMERTAVIAPVYGRVIDELRKEIKEVEQAIQRQSGVIWRTGKPLMDAVAAYNMAVGEYHVLLQTIRRVEAVHDTFASAQLKLGEIVIRGEFVKRQYTAVVGKSHGGQLGDIFS